MMEGFLAVCTFKLKPILIIKTTISILNMFHVPGFEVCMYFKSYLLCEVDLVSTISWECWDAEKLNHLPAVTKPVSGKAGIGSLSGPRASALS